MSEDNIFIKNGVFYKYKYLNDKPLEKVLELNDDMKTDIIVVDNFYKDPQAVRNFALSQDFDMKGNYPGHRTRQLATENIKEKFQEMLKFNGKLTNFSFIKDPNSISNGCFQITTSYDRSWIHNDEPENWAGIIYLTPNAPLNAGTSFYILNEITTEIKDIKSYSDNDSIKEYTSDLTKWKIVDKIGNVFNRLILFNSKRFHMSDDYFGTTKENGRLTQVFFFSTE